jgi:hypothetical protein
MSDIERGRKVRTCSAACQAAVLRAFNELRGLGQCEETALRAALKVFAFHEPGTPAHVASAIVEGWTRSVRAGAAALH